MRFGWLTLALSPSPAEDAARIDQQIELVSFAELLGFGDVWLTEHYFTGESVYNDALLFASAIAMRTRKIRIGFAVVQLPFHHPVRLAVQLALLDNPSKGGGHAAWVAAISAAVSSRRMSIRSNR